jgi:hypothetical protein
VQRHGAGPGGLAGLLNTVAVGSLVLAGQAALAVTRSWDHFMAHSPWGALMCAHTHTVVVVVCGGGGCGGGTGVCTRVWGKWLALVITTTECLFLALPVLSTSSSS